MQFLGNIIVYILVASVCHGARVTLLGSTPPNCPITTNSVLADISLDDGVAVSFSPTDSQVSLSPFDDDWTAIDDGTLFGDLTVVSGASNVVTILFGDAADPAFTIESNGEWTISPSGQLAPLMNVPHQLPVQTNRLSFVMRIPHGQPLLEARASANGSVSTNLPLVTWHWDNPAPYPENWKVLSLQLAGPEAKILDFRLKWRPEGTHLIFR
jgi:hypothetical protein